MAGEKSKHPELSTVDAVEVARNPRDGEFESSDSSSDFVVGISSGIEKSKADEDINLEYKRGLTSTRYSESTLRLL